MKQRSKHIIKKQLDKKALEMFKDLSQDDEKYKTPWVLQPLRLPYPVQRSQFCG